jgi:hypothetical protein
VFLLSQFFGRVATAKAACIPHARGFEQQWIYRMDENCFFINEDGVLGQKAREVRRCFGSRYCYLIG